MIRPDLFRNGMGERCVLCVLGVLPVCFFRQVVYLCCAVLVDTCTPERREEVLPELLMTGEIVFTWKTVLV